MNTTSEPIPAQDQPPIIELIDALAQILFRTETYAKLSIQEVAKLCRKHRIKSPKLALNTKALVFELICYFDKHDYILTPHTKVTYRTEPTYLRSGSGEIMYLKFEPYQPAHRI